MATPQTRPLAQDKFLIVAVNLLHRAFLECTRADAKQRFRKLCDGNSLHLGDVTLEDESAARFAVALDSSEYIGKLNFSGFRTSIEVLLANFVQALREERELPVFSSQDEDSTIFGVTGVTATGNHANVLVLAVSLGAGGDITRLQLMYLDPSQFQQQ